MPSCRGVWDRRQYEQDSHDKLVQTIEGQDLLPPVSWALAAGASSSRTKRRGGSFHDFHWLTVHRAYFCRACSRCC